METFNKALSFILGLVVISVFIIIASGKVMVPKELQSEYVWKTRDEQCIKEFGTGFKYIEGVHSPDLCVTHDGQTRYYDLIKNKVDEETIDRAVFKLTSEQEVQKSKQLPFRFTTAYKIVEGNRKFTDAISYAMDLSVQNTPRLPGKTLIAIDSSGSMSGDPMEKASIFGATLAKSNPNSDVILYDTNIKILKISGRTPVIDIAKEIEREAMGGGTQTSLVFTYAIQEKKIYDRIIIISDNESWTEGWGGNGVQEYYNKYKTMADPFVYAIDIQGYGTKDVTGSKVFHLTGWSNRLLDFIGRMEEGQSLVDYVTNYAREKAE